MAERPKCPMCGSGMDAWGCVKCGNTRTTIPLLEDEPEIVVAYLWTIDQVIHFNQGLEYAEKLPNVIVFYATPSSVGLSPIRTDRRATDG